MADYIQWPCAVCGKSSRSRNRRTCGSNACIQAAVRKGQFSGGAVSAVRAKTRRANPYTKAGVFFVPLTQNAFTKIDVRDAARVMRLRWYLYRDPATGRMYAVREERGRPVRLHRWLLNAGATEDVDHVNGDGLDNRRENLRKATEAQNSRNARKRALCTSKYKGVGRDKSSSPPWRARIRLNRRLIHLGRFVTEEEAARAYDEAARRLHGEFARVNFPIGDEQSALH